jgi:hypothetical protein
MRRRSRGRRRSVDRGTCGLGIEPRNHGRSGSRRCVPMRKAGRGQHDALDALAVGIEKKDVCWVLDADIRGFFDAIDHGWMMKFIEHRIGDTRILRLISKWLKAGVFVQGELTFVEEGTPQGAAISPLLANIFLHYVFDQPRHPRARRPRSCPSRVRPRPRCHSRRVRRCGSWALRHPRR